jgi:hypothetical protein
MDLYGIFFFSRCLAIALHAGGFVPFTGSSCAHG